MSSKKISSISQNDLMVHPQIAYFLIFTSPKRHNPLFEVHPINKIPHSANPQVDTFLNCHFWRLKNQIIYATNLTVIRYKTVRPDFCGNWMRLINLIEPSILGSKTELWLTTLDLNLKVQRWNEFLRKIESIWVSRAKMSSEKITSCW